jgi:hypothetical protein
MVIQKNNQKIFYLLAFLSLFATTKQLQAQTFICIGEDQVPEYTQRKTGKNCKAVNLPGISYGSGATNSNYVYKLNKPKSNSYGDNSTPAYNKPKVATSTPLTNPNAGLNTPPPLPSSSSGYAPPSSLPKNLGGGRKSILQQELTEKQSKLNTLQQEFNQGQPSRTEKNYQTYLDRTKRLGDEINRTKGDIDALLREMNM